MRASPRPTSIPPSAVSVPSRLCPRATRPTRRNRANDPSLSVFRRTTRPRRRARARGGVHAKRGLGVDAHVPRRPTRPLRRPRASPPLPSRRSDRRRRWANRLPPSTRRHKLEHGSEGAERVARSATANTSRRSSVMCASAARTPSPRSPPCAEVARWWATRCCAGSRRDAARPRRRATDAAAAASRTDVPGAIADGVRGDANARGVGGDDPASFERLVIARRHTASQAPVVRQRQRDINGVPVAPRRSPVVQKRLAAGDAKASATNQKRRRVDVDRRARLVRRPRVLVRQRLGNSFRFSPASGDARPVRQGQVGADVNATESASRGVARNRDVRGRATGKPSRPRRNSRRGVDVAEIAHARHAEREQMIERAAKRGVARLLRRRRDRRRHERRWRSPSASRGFPSASRSTIPPGGSATFASIPPRATRNARLATPTCASGAEEPRLDVAREP